MNTDVLVVGGGVSGLRAAIKASEKGSNVTLVTKGKIGTGSETAYLDHLIELTVLAVSDSKKDNELFISDLLNFGRNMNDEKLVNTFVTNSNEEYQYVRSIGIEMEEDPRTYPSHRSPRLKKGIGHFGESLLSKMKNEAIINGVNIIENATLYEVENNEKIRRSHVLLRGKGNASTNLTINFTSLILATGGTGQLFSVSTNPSGSTGDGVGLAFRLGAKITNLEFLHFLPLLIKPIKGFYIVSSIFTKGRLYNSDGVIFQPIISPEEENMEPAELQGNILLQACQWIQEQILNGKVTENNGVYWDGRHLEEEINNKMPNSYQKLKSLNLDLLEEQAEISVGCHQMLGGVQIDGEGKTSLSWLFAAGEVAGGFQGAERLMGTGVMDGLVFGARAGESAAEFAKDKDVKKKETKNAPLECNSSSFDVHELANIKQKLRNTMDKVLITKDKQRLTLALEEVSTLYHYIQSKNILTLPLENRIAVSECKNMLLLAAAFLEVSLERKETRGSFIRNDYPEKKSIGKPSNVQLSLNSSNLKFNIQS